MKLFLSNKLGYDENKAQLLSEFILFCAENLPIEDRFEVHVVCNRQPHGISTTAVYEVNNNCCKIYGKNRALVDVMRSIAHEMTHMMQDEMGLLVGHIQDAGGFHEDQANAKAGELIKLFAKSKKDRKAIYESKRKTILPFNSIINEINAPRLKSGGNPFGSGGGSIIDNDTTGFPAPDIKGKFLSAGKSIKSILTPNDNNEINDPLDRWAIQYFKKDFFDKWTDAGYDVIVTSGYRTIEKQASLQSNQQSVALGAAKAGKSPHQFGLAVDINIKFKNEEGKEIHLKASTPNDIWLKHIKKAEIDIENTFQWGGYFKKRDAVHFDLYPKLGVGKGEKNTSGRSEFVTKLRKSAGDGVNKKYSDIKENKILSFQETIKEGYDELSSSSQTSSSSSASSSNNTSNSNQETIKLGNEDFESGKVTVNKGVKWGPGNGGTKRSLAFRALSYFLPNGTVLTSCYRSQEDQNNIIKNYAVKKGYKGDQNDFDKMHAFTKKKGLIIARKVGRGHGGVGETGAFDFSGVPLDQIWKGVENANEKLAGKMKFAKLKAGRGKQSIIERENNAVHVHFNLSDVKITDADIKSLKSK